MEQNITNKKVSVIIVSYNNQDWVEQCLDSLVNQEYSQIEVIWVDNNSKDATIEKVQQKKYEKLAIKLILTKDNLGFAGGNNAGLQHATGDIIFLLNSDARIEPDAISNAVKVFETHSDVGIVQNLTLKMKDLSKVDSAGSQFTFTGFLKHINQDETDITKEYEIFSGKGASLFIKREFLNKSYLFHPLFESYFEDTDVSWRAWIAGYKVLYTPKGISVHNGGATALFLQSGRTDFHSFKNRLFSILTCLQKRNIVTILPVHIAICLVVSAMYLFRGRAEKAFAVIRAIWWNIKHIKDIQTTRKQIQSTRVWTDKQIFKNTMQPFTIKYAMKALFGYTSF